MTLLREVLQKLVDGSHRVEEDMVSTYYGRHISMSQYVSKQLPEGYLFYDWFLRVIINIYKTDIRDWHRFDGSVLVFLILAFDLII